MWCFNKESLLVFFLNFWQGEILHPVKMMINSGFCCEFPAGTAPKPGLSVRYTRLCSVVASAPSSPKGMDIVFSHNGELSIKMERHSAYRTHEVKHNRLLAGTEALFQGPFIPRTLAVLPLEYTGFIFSLLLWKREASSLQHAAV